MSGLVALVPFPVPSWLNDFKLRAQLAAAERALDHPFDKGRSLEIDRLDLRIERARRHAAGRGHRRVA